VENEYTNLLNRDDDILISDPELEATENSKKGYAIEALSDFNNRDYVNSKSRDSIEYFLFELLTSQNSSTVFDKSTIANHRNRDQMLSNIENFKAEIGISQSLLEKNPGIDPRSQNNLLQYLRLACNEVGLNRFYENLFVPINNPFALNSEKLSSILTICNEHLHFPKRSDRVVTTSNRMVRWLHEQTIGEFINSYVRNLEVDNSLSILGRRMSVIEEVIDYMTTLEREVSFEGPKYLKCFYDIAISVLVENGWILLDVREKISGFPLSTEVQFSTPDRKNVFYFLFWL